MKLIFILITSFLFWDCAIHNKNQVIIKKDNPIPNEVKSKLFPRNPSEFNITDIKSGKFRDASIHVGREKSTVLDFHGGNGPDAIALLNLSALPHKDMLNTEISKWDLSQYNLIEINGVTKGCQIGITIPLGGRNNSRGEIPINFKFSQRSFYYDLRASMNENKVKALFDSKLDKDTELYIFGIFRRECFRFKAFGIQEKEN